MPREFCFYCGDTDRKPGWQHIGGTIGESHYVCLRKKCQRARLAHELRRAKALAERKAKRDG